MLTQERANEIFEYRDGNLYWKHRLLSRNRPSEKAGMLVGVDDGRGYLKVGVDKKRYYAHQIVFLMHNGYIPECVDHIDGNPANNKIENLRAANKSLNAYNSKTRSDNTSSCKGVVWSKAANKWIARIQFNKKQKHLGVFEDYELACLVAAEARNLYHGNFARNQ